MGRIWHFKEMRLAREFEGRLRFHRECRSFWESVYLKTLDKKLADKALDDFREEFKGSLK